MKYAVVAKNNIEELVEAVNGMCAKGWEPVGGLFLTPGHTFVQSMKTNKKDAK